MVVLTAEVVHNRLQDIKNPTQEAIETMSLWIMHYKDKASIDVIVQGWLDCFKTGSEARRIALFYVMNDVVQKAKMKHADTLIPAFQPAVLTAVGSGRKHEKVKEVMKRCIQIFKSRNVFSPASITAMMNMLASDEAYDAEDQALEVDADDLFKKITNFVSARNLVADMMKIVNEGDFDYKEKCRTEMKDRESGAHILQEVHEAIDTMVQVRHSMENQKKKMMALSESLELAKRVFLHQKREVLVVEEAYVNFRDGIKAVHTDLVEMEAKGVYPGILSPSNEDDPYTPTGQAFRQQAGLTSWGDNRAPMDMEMDEEERPQAPMMKPSLQALVGIASQPSLQSRIMQLGLKKIADGDEKMFQKDQKQPAVTAAAPMPSDFTRPPPIFGAGGPTGAAATGSFVNQSAIPPASTAIATTGVPAALPSDPRKRSETDAMAPSPYAMTFQQQAQTVLPSPQAPPAATVYQGHFEARDPRMTTAQPPAQQPVYRGQFEQRDPRMIHQQVPPPVAPIQTAYQGTFDGPPQQIPSGLISPQAPQQGGYQARFDTKPMPTSSGMQMSPPMAQNNQYQGYQQQQQRGPPPQQQGYGDYHAGGGDHNDRFDRGGGGAFNRNGGYHQNDGARGAPYNNPRGQDQYGGGRGGRGGAGGGGGGYNDRNGRRDNWRGGNSNRGGGFNRY